MPTTTSAERAILSMLARYRRGVLADDVAYEVGLPSAKVAQGRLRQLRRRALVYGDNHTHAAINWTISELGLAALAVSS